MRNAGFDRGRVLLISDEIAAADVDKLAQQLNSRAPDAGHWQLSILGVGTDQGAPIPLAAAGDSTEGGGFLKQRDGQIVIAQLHRERFARLAQQTQGLYSDLRADDRDLDQLLPATLPTEDRTRAVQREFDQWRERGTWLAIGLLPLAALAFRRGWLLLLLVLPLSPPAQSADTAPSPSAVSSMWRDLWQNPDQQATQALDAGDAKAAAAKFRDPAWRSAALYRAGDYAAAAQALDGSDYAEADYNRGNALARAGQLQQALDAYDAALKKNPQSADAKANRELVEKLLQQQKQQQQSAQQNKGSQQNDGSHQDSQKSQDSQSAAGKSSGTPQDGSKNAQQAADTSKQNGERSAGNANPQDASQQSSQKHDPQPPDASQPPPGGGRSGGAGQQANTGQSAREQGGAQAAQAQRDGREPAKNDAQAAAEAQGDQEQQQQQRATEQWLRQVPDDPSGLLRRKFLYEHRQREREATPRDNAQPLW
jgi:Ca-activated chloride channel family protein